MKVELCPTLNYIRDEDIKGKAVVVIDVLRATSVITTAINNGAKEVIVTIETEDAMRLKDKNSLLGGERKGLKIQGFDLSNSPLEYKKEVVLNKRIVISTTNGTKAIKMSEKADKIYIASMLNGNAVAETLIKEGLDVVIICAGTNGRFSLDDYACAGKIIYNINEKHEIDMDDFAISAYAAYRDHKANIIDYISMAKHYKYLLSIGYGEDIKYCFTEDIMRVVPEYINESIRIKK